MRLPIFRLTQRGFTLVELMIVTAIISILAAIGVPMYNEYVLQSRMTEAYTTLADMRVRAEQYFADNRTYAVIAPAVTPPYCVVPAGATRYFAYDCQGVPDATTYTLRAVAQNTLTMTGATYTVNQANARTSTYIGQFAAAGWVNNATCWSTKKNAC